MVERSNIYIDFTGRSKWNTYRGEHMVVVDTIIIDSRILSNSWQQNIEGTAILDLHLSFLSLFLIWPIYCWIKNICLYVLLSLLVLLFPNDTFLVVGLNSGFSNNNYLSTTISNTMKSYPQLKTIQVKNTSEL